MPGGAIAIMQGGTEDLQRIEAPVTTKAYLLCVFASFGGILFGYDSGYISGVLAMPYFISTIGDGTSITSSHQSLIVSILSAGTFFGAIIAGDLADCENIAGNAISLFIDKCVTFTGYGRRTTLLAGCAIFIVGVVLQIGSHGLSLLVAGRLVAGLGVGFVSAIVILYMSEIAPRKVRGAIVSGYQFAVTIGLLLASCVDYATKDLDSAAAYRIPIGIQLAWPVILAAGIFILPESPRWFVKKGEYAKAAHALARVRGQPEDSAYIQDELAEIITNNEHEKSLMPSTTYFGSWAQCFEGSLWIGSSNLRRTILGTSLQMMQQWTGVNFVFYFGSTFFTSLGTISNPFLISLITTLVNVCSTPVSFYTVEKFGRRPIMIWGALGMFTCELLVAILGTAIPNDVTAVKVMIAFICIYIFFFATTWGPGAWVLIGEIFPLPIRSRGVGLSTASNWLWNCIIGIITPYLVATTGKTANLGPRVFWIWTGTCGLCFVYAYFLIPETKGLTLEQVDRMLEEVSARRSAGWQPSRIHSAEYGMAEKAITTQEKGRSSHHDESR